MTGAASPATLDTVARKLESLQRHIESLDISMQRLFVRIVPADDEWNAFQGQISREWEGPYARPELKNQPSTIETLVGMIREADAHIEGIERDFGTVKARIDGLEHGALLRDEIEGYIKNPRKKR